MYKSTLKNSNSSIFYSLVDGFPAKEWKLPETEWAEGALTGRRLELDKLTLLEEEEGEEEGLRLQSDSLAATATMSDVSLSIRPSSSLSLSEDDSDLTQPDEQDPDLDLAAPDDSNDSLNINNSSNKMPLPRSPSELGLLFGISSNEVFTGGTLP